MTKYFLWKEGNWRVTKEHLAHDYVWLRLERWNRWTESYSVQLFQGVRPEKINERVEYFKRIAAIEVAKETLDVA